MRPNDQRNLVHGRIGRAIGGFIGGGPLGAVTGFVGGGGGGGGSLAMSLGLPPKPPNQSASTYVRNTLAQGFSLNDIALVLGKVGGQSAGTFFRALGITVGNGAEPGSGGGGCADPRLEPTGPGGRCEFPGSPASGMGELRKGRYGPAEEPFFETRNIRSCLAGFVLGDDSLCYKKGTISNKQRMWPKGTAPLLTGGQMKAIRVAAGAGAKLDRTTKRLQRLGFMKKPAARRPAAHQHAKAVPNIVSL